MQFASKNIKSELLFVVMRGDPGQATTNQDYNALQFNRSGLLRVMIWVENKSGLIHVMIWVIHDEKYISGLFCITI